jgi:hypothetical protein
MNNPQLSRKEKKKYKKCHAFGCKKPAYFYFGKKTRIYPYQYSYCPTHTTLMVQQKAFKTEPKRIPQKYRILNK